jgi:hypothetical protein
MDKRLSLVQRILNGEIYRSKQVSKHYWLVGVVSVFFFVSVLMGFISEWQYVRIQNLQKELQDARNEELTISSELASSTRQSAVARELKERGSRIKEANKPVIYIK